MSKGRKVLCIGNNGRERDITVGKVYEVAIEGGTGNVAAHCVRLKTDDTGRPEPLYRKERFAPACEVSLALWASEEEPCS